MFYQFPLIFMYLSGLALSNPHNPPFAAPKPPVIECKQEVEDDE